jgi:23S rRNA (pseudouridine1915-N3)-methyltransferase
MIKVLAGGRKSVGWAAEGVNEYARRLIKYWGLEWRFVDEGRLGEAVAKSGREVYIIVLDERGEEVSSPELAAKLGGLIEGGREVVFVIGGAYGVSSEARERADFVWSLGRLVFPHEICRMLLAEQVYRAQEIYRGRPYHHA